MFLRFIKKLFLPVRTETESELCLPAATVHLPADWIILSIFYSIIRPTAYLNKINIFSYSDWDDHDLREDTPAVTYFELAFRATVGSSLSAVITLVEFAVNKLIDSTDVNA